MGDFRFLERKNALALLPFVQADLPEFEAALIAIDKGQNGGKVGCIRELTRHNKNTKKWKSWKRLKPIPSCDVVIDYENYWFELPPNQHDFFISYGAWFHGTPQSPMLRIHFRRCAGVKPTIPDGESRYLEGKIRSCRSVSIPLQCVLKNWGDAGKGYMIYEHMFAPMDAADQQFDPLCYTGLTSRDWLTRFAEHKRDAMTGSSLLFHASLQRVYDNAQVIQRGMGPYEVVRAGVLLYSELHYVNLNYEEAMQVEEELVKKSLAPKGLNMIPGGFAGMRYLHKLGLLNKNRVTVEDRDEAIVVYMKKNPVKGRPAPWVAEHWEKDEFYEKVILGRSNTLSRDQVLQIRKYGEEWGLSIKLIASMSGANVRQVRDVLSGKHYSRIR